MKNKIALALVLILGACTGSKTSDGSGSNDSINMSDSIIPEQEILTFDSVTYHQTKYLKEKGQAPSIDLQFCIEYAQGESTLDSTINAEITKFIFHKTDLSVNDAMHAYIDSLCEAESSEILEFYDDTDPELNDCSNYEHELTCSVHKNSREGVIVYEYNGYSYLGGAHGGSAVSYMNLDAKTGRRIKLTNVFPKEKKKELIELIKQQLVIDNNCKSWNELMETTDIGSQGPIYVSNNNFALNKDGVEFTYNQYEIGPYSCGIISTTIPYEKLQGIINLK